jgi:hypothetical protein
MGQASWASVRGSRPPGRHTLSRVIQGGLGGNDGGRLQHPGWPGGWQKSSPLTPNNHSRHQQLNRYHPRSSRPATRGDLCHVGDAACEVVCYAAKPADGTVCSMTT